MVDCATTLSTAFGDGVWGDWLGGEEVGDEEDMEEELRTLAANWAR